MAQKTRLCQQILLHPRHKEWHDSYRSVPAYPDSADKCDRIHVPPLLVIAICCTADDKSLFLRQASQIRQRAKQVQILPSVIGDHAFTDCGGVARIFLQAYGWQMQNQIQATRSPEIHLLNRK